MENTETPFKKMQRTDFLSIRARGVEQARHHKAMLGNPESLIIVDAGDEVVCDFCNALITGKWITLNQRGTKAFCLVCRERVSKLENGGVHG